MFRIYLALCLIGLLFNVLTGAIQAQYQHENGDRRVSNFPANTIIMAAPPNPANRVLRHDMVGMVAADNGSNYPMRSYARTYTAQGVRYVVKPLKPYQAQYSAVQYLPQAMSTRQANGTHQMRRATRHQLYADAHINPSHHTDVFVRRPHDSNLMRHAPRQIIYVNTVRQTGHVAKFKRQKNGISIPHMVSRGTKIVPEPHVGDISALRGGPG